MTEPAVSGTSSRTAASGTATRTTCPYCGVGCGVLATVDGTIAGDPDHPANLGRLCSKGTALGETLGLDRRLLHPEIGGRRAGWDAALDLIATRFAATIAAHGPDSVALYVSGQLLTEDYYVANKLAKSVFGTANIDSNSRLCMASAVAGHRRAFGEDLVPGIYADLEQADLVVLVGSNTAWCHPVLFQRILAARAERPQMRLVVIDPRRTATCEDADLHLPLRPGSDVALFNGLLTDLAAHGLGVTPAPAGCTEALAAAQADLATTAAACGLREADLATFFAWVRETPRTVTLFSQGVNQSTAGTDKVNAIINTHLFTGRIGLPGAGPFSVTGQPNAMGGREVGALSNMLAAHLDWDRPGDIDKLRRFWGTDAIPTRPGLKAVELFDAIAAGRVRAVWILGTNPAVSLPRGDAVRAALERCDFVVVSEVSTDSDTARYAHVRLPALGWGEKNGTVTNSERVISRQRAFRPWPGEARPDWHALAGVAARMGHGPRFTWTGPAGIFREHAALSGYGNDGTRVFDISAFAELDDAAYDAMPPTRWPCPAKGPAPDRLFADGRYPNGGARMVPLTPRPEAAEDAAAPLVLLTGRLRDQWHTMTRTGSVPRLMAHAPEPVVAAHSGDTAIPDGALARIRTTHGSAVLRLRHDRGLRRGTIFAPMHWTATLCPAARINAAVAPAVDPVSGQPALKFTPATLEAFTPAWTGFLLLRERLAPGPGLAAWCAVVAEPGGVWRHELAGTEPPAQAWARLVALLGVDEAWLRLDDPGQGRHRAVRMHDGAPAAALFLAADGVLPSPAWLVRQFAADTAASRLALLAGSAPDAAPSAPLVCVCNGVDAAVIGCAIRDGARTVAEIGAATTAGTGCGSCRPELRGMLAAATVPEPA